jgi:hypothetical protein
VQELSGGARQSKTGGKLFVAMQGRASVKLVHGFCGEASSDTQLVVRSSCLVALILLMFHGVGVGVADAQHHIADPLLLVLMDVY